MKMAMPNFLANADVCISLKVDRFTNEQKLDLGQHPTAKGIPNAAVGVKGSLIIARLF